MNKNEFLEMQTEFAETIYNYERFIKDGVLLDYYYNAAFYPQLSRIHYLEVENVMLAKALTAISTKDGGDPDEIIKNFKEGYAKELPQLEKKNQYSNILVSHVSKNTKEARVEFEGVWKKFIHEHHPVVQTLMGDKDKEKYNMLLAFYYEDNYEGFKNLYKTLQPQFETIEYPDDEELYTKISQYYYEMRERIGQDFNKRNTGYPYNKKDALIDEISIAREQGELKSRITELIRDNKKMHEDFVNIFKNDVRLMDTNPEA